MPARSPLIFLADDQADVLTSLRLLLKGEGYATETFTAPDALFEALRQRTADAVLLDLNYTRDTTSGREGLDAIGRIRDFDAATPIIAMTAWGSIELAVEAMRRGAQDFIEKPWDNARLLAVLRNQVALGRALRREQALLAVNRDLSGAAGGLIAASPAMRPVLETIERIAPSDVNVLITGESGCGKGLVARLIHEHSPRRERSLVVVNIGSLAETIFESELFGHVKGAFTDAKADRVGRFELADGGTLFLDEIANIPVTQQGRLLRVLEEGCFERLGSSRTQRADVRVLAATNADLAAEINAGRFRADLLYRLNTIHLHLPPLRERGDDIPLLARDFLARHARQHRRPVATLTDAALAALRRYHWPGNVRELSHVIERAVLLARGTALGPDDLLLKVAVAAPGAAPPLTLDAIELEAIRAALARHDGNVVAAAQMLGVSRSALYRRMEKFGL
ncbi:MAG: sigma-54-dependent Fis family transcriptional regulator [Gammaproteobacteria bacterium]|nr:sigma-54-dependent Fis family transcriptional regulator [Gammaproteobacteria bacterium]